MISTSLGNSEAAYLLAFSDTCLISEYEITAGHRAMTDQMTRLHGHLTRQRID